MFRKRGGGSVSRQFAAAAEGSVELARRKKRSTPAIPPDRPQTEQEASRENTQGLKRKQEEKDEEEEEGDEEEEEEEDEDDEEQEKEEQSVREKKKRRAGKPKKKRALGWFLSTAKGDKRMCVLCSYVQGINKFRPENMERHWEANHPRHLKAVTDANDDGKDIRAVVETLIAAASSQGPQDAVQHEGDAVGGRLRGPQAQVVQQEGQWRLRRGRAPQPRG